MHRIDADGHVNNLFSESPPGTRVDAAIMNAIQEELCNLLEAMGVTLTKGTWTQLRDACVSAATASKIVRRDSNAGAAFGPVTTGALTTGAITASGKIAATATGADTGVTGTGGGTNGMGVEGIGTATGPGVYGHSFSGPGVKAAGNTSRAALQIVPQSAPVVPNDGDVWIDSSTNTLKIRIGGATKTVTLT